MADDNRKLRKKQKNDVFMPSDLDDPSDILRYIPNPEPHLMRVKARAAGKRAELPPKQVLCPHPMHAVVWMKDFENERDRYGRPTNLFICEDCDATLFLVDGNGKSASDG